MPVTIRAALQPILRQIRDRTPQANRKRNAVLALASAAFLLFWFALDDPLFDTPYSTILQSRDGHLMGARIAKDGQWRFPVNPEIPEKFRTALIQFEDKRFYVHPGVDPVAMLRAIFLNLRHRSVVSGGSTLSMQVIRLSRQNPSRTYFEKLREVILALRLELTYSKAEILALYAAHAPFGGNVIGLETAAWRYFGRRPQQLSWAESCMLAVLPNSPALIHPGKNRDLLKAKRDRLINKLHEQGILDATQTKLALLEPLPAKPVALPQIAPHLLETLIQQQPQQHRFITTVQPRLQNAINDIVQHHAEKLQRRHIYNAAVLVIDNQTFDVITYIGNSDFSNQSEFGYAIDIIHRPRSTGSILKPLLYANMLQHGEILPKTLIPDVPSKYNGFIPQNYDRRFRGAVPADIALIHSLNVPAVYMLKQYGITRFYGFLKNAGMDSLYRPPDEYGLTLILGGAEGTLWDMTRIYSNLAWLAQQTTPAHRTYRTPRLLIAGSTDMRQTAELDPAAAWLTLEALLDVNRPGDEGHWKNFNNKQKIAWKTGTSYGLRDAWAIGTTKRYTIGVWVGNATGEGRPGLTGVSAAAPLMFDI
ncbi:MAG: penicillin-binding protein 1C, partial [Gammaproteobacteria bacterium]|nr:penicillin-binding protein 1C [Gammaproteobacteria bacterium]